MKKKIVLMFLSFVLCMSAIGCSSTASTNSGSSSSEADSSSVKEITVATSKDVNDLNVHLYDGLMAAQAMVYEPLVVNGENGIEPGLAESWKISDDGKEYTFKLREGVKFHDGEALNADVVKLNFEALLNNKERHTWLSLMNKIEGMEAVDEYTFKLTLSEAYYPTLEELGLTRPFRIMSPKDFIDGESKDGVNGNNGTGAYKLVEHKADQYAVFEANNDYWGGAPDIQKITFKVMPTGQTTLLALQKGEIDFTYTEMLDADSISALSADKNFQVVTSEPMSTKILVINTSDSAKATADKNVRNAIWYAIDKESIANVIMTGTESAANSLFSKNTPYCDIDLEEKAFDVEKAKQLLDEAGWKLEEGQEYRTKDGKTLELDFVYSTDRASRKAISEFIQSNLKDVGIKTNLIGEENTAVLDRRNNSGEYDLLFDATWGAPYDPQTSFSAFKSHYVFTFKGLDNVDEIYRSVDDILVSTDEQKRQELYTSVLTQVHDEAIFIPLTYSGVTAVSINDIENITFNRSIYEMPFERMTMK